ncbi:RING-H2 finger protein [Amycolatopsis sp. SID8362]|uniref:RING finger protein n=1 Tax=Amycolatopsis sp. SID8362 TaxID=2690346 RepID=UPI00144DE632|nr:RING-H2 finger protein [Amycolatopsis sp. SID8362]NBH06080.1 hypothetical protein [Amycolatopsis sp. SID8362]
MEGSDSMPTTRHFDSPFDEGLGWWSAVDDNSYERCFLQSDVEPADPNVAGLNWITKTEYLAIRGRFDSPDEVGQGWWCVLDENTGESWYLQSDVEPANPNAEGLNWITAAAYRAIRGRFGSPKNVGEGWWRAIDENTDEPWYLHSDVTPANPNAEGLNWIIATAYRAIRGHFSRDVESAGRGWWSATDENTKEKWYLHSDVKPANPNAEGLNWITRTECIAIRGRFGHLTDLGSGWWRAADDNIFDYWYIHSDVEPADPNAEGLNWITRTEYIATRGRFSRVKRAGDGWWRTIDRNTDQDWYLHSDDRPENPNAEGLNWITRYAWSASLEREWAIDARGRFGNLEGLGPGWWRATDDNISRDWYLQSDVEPADPNAEGLNWITRTEYIAIRGCFSRVQREAPGWWRAINGNTDQDWYLHSVDRPENPNATGLTWITATAYRAILERDRAAARARGSREYPLGQAPDYDALPAGDTVTLTSGGAVKTADQALVDTCIICQDNFTENSEIAQPAGGCPHYFHWACLAAWAYPQTALLQDNPNIVPTCPTCRQLLRSRPGETPERTPLKITAITQTTTPETAATPEDATTQIGLRSEDGNYWWDGTQWQPIPQPPEPQQHPTDITAGDTPEQQAAPVSADAALHYVTHTYHDTVEDSDERRNLFRWSGDPGPISGVTITLAADDDGWLDNQTLQTHGDPTGRSGEWIWQLEIRGLTVENRTATVPARLCTDPTTAIAWIEFDPGTLP